MFFGDVRKFILKRKNRWIGFSSSPSHPQTQVYMVVFNKEIGDIYYKFEIIVPKMFDG